MDTSNLSSLVSYAPGFLYKYIGSVANVSDVALHVTQQAVAAVGDSTIVTNVLILNKLGIVLYTPVELANDNFILIGAVESAPVVETPVEETPEGGV